MSARDVEKDYYAALGVAKDASAADIKKAYRKLARELHPDTNPGGEARFKDVSEAYDVLSDTAKLGLEQYGAAGEPFDPAVHEALMAAEPDPEASVATCAAVFQKGYRMSGGRVLRPARVSVAEPGATSTESS